MTEKCLLCETANVGNPIDAINTIFSYNCPNCGSYYISERMKNELVRNWKLLSSMYYYLLQNWREKPPFPFFVINGADKNDNEQRKYIFASELENLFPKTFSEQVDKALLNLSVVYPEYDSAIYLKNAGNVAEIHRDIPIAEKVKKLTFVDCEITEKDYSGIKKIMSFLNLMIDMGYLNEDGKSTGEHYYHISSKGWIRVQELENQYKVNPQCFIVMWFDNSMTAVRESIKSAITECGYIPMIIDDKEHNNQIVPEILHEIKQSIFMIADLTEHRNGVYYEEGYAQALGKEVILSCKKDNFDNRHFDVSQKNTIKWNTPDELKEKLVKRIKATVGENT